MTMSALRIAPAVFLTPYFLTSVIDNDFINVEASGYLNTDFAHKARQTFDQLSRATHNKMNAPLALKVVYEGVDGCR